jgi:hypothetical protein
MLDEANDFLYVASTGALDSEYPLTDYGVSPTRSTLSSASREGGRARRYP